MFKPNELQLGILRRLDELKGAKLANAEALSDLADPKAVLAALQYLHSRGLVEVENHEPDEDIEFPVIRRWGRAFGIGITLAGYAVLDSN